MIESKTEYRSIEVYLASGDDTSHMRIQRFGQVTLRFSKRVSEGHQDRALSMPDQAEQKKLLKIADCIEKAASIHIEKRYREYVSLEYFVKQKKLYGKQQKPSPLGPMLLKDMDQNILSAILIDAKNCYKNTRRKNHENLIT